MGYGSAFARANAFLRHDEPGPGEAERPSYATIDVGGGWDLGRGLELRVLVNQLTNRVHAASADAVAPLAAGRSVVMSLSGIWTSVVNRTR